MRKQKGTQDTLTSDGAALSYAKEGAEPGGAPVRVWPGALRAPEKLTVPSVSPRARKAGSWA